MVASSNYQLGIWKLLRHNLESLDHEFKPLVGSPFSESQNAVHWIATA
jgi:hypothetical protein